MSVDFVGELPFLAGFAITISGLERARLAWPGASLGARIFSSESTGAYYALWRFIKPGSPTSRTVLAAVIVDECTRFTLINTSVFVCGTSYPSSLLIWASIAFRSLVHVIEIAFRAIATASTFAITSRCAVSGELSKNNMG